MKNKQQHLYIFIMWSEEFTIGCRGDSIQNCITQFAAEMSVCYDVLYNKEQNCDFHEYVMHYIAYKHDKIICLFFLY